MRDDMLFVVPKSDDTIGMRRIHSDPEDRRHYCRMR